MPAAADLADDAGVLETPPQPLLGSLLTLGGFEIYALVLAGGIGKAQLVFYLDYLLDDFRVVDNDEFPGL